MSRPRPLSSTAAYRNLDQQLTPRTPHSGSRTSRLEQGFSKIPLSEGNDADDDDQGTLQSAPLLASSTTARFSANPSRRRPDPSSSDRDGKRPIRHPTQMLYHTISRLPLAFGIFLAGILLILLVLSFMKPDALHRYIGAKAPNATASQSSSSTTTNAKTHTSQPLAHSSSHTDIHIISYENYTTFPLHPTEYFAECNKLHQGYMAHGAYWDIGPMGAMDVEHAEDNENSPKTVCSSTVTYMLDGKVGLSADLALMAQAAALAHERNRTFFVDDTYWNRGKWHDHFEDTAKGQPGPEPGCLPPPPNGMWSSFKFLACNLPFENRIGSLPSDGQVINSRTARFHFGHEFSENYEDPYAHQLNRLKPIFESSGQSLESVIVPNKYNMGLIRLAREEFLGFVQNVNQGASGMAATSYVAAHIRRGDRKSLSYLFPGQKIPIEDYSDAVTSSWKRLNHGSISDHKPVVYLATDSPDAYYRFSEVYQGDLFSLFDTVDPRLRSLVSPGEYFQKTFNELDVHERITATRGMIVDLALISGLWPDGDREEMLPQAVICALSSTVCRLAPIGLGWDNAFGHVGEEGYMDEKNKHWVEIDEKGQVVPVWQAFELF